MITLTELIQFTSLLISVAGLFEFVRTLIAFATFIYKISKKNNRQPGNWRLFKIINQ